MCPRTAGKGGWLKKEETSTIYTHYQKSVIVNADAGNYRRKIIAFVGGLDLCKGRYVAPKHQIFSTLQTVHKDDYHNHNFISLCLSGIQPGDFGLDLLWRNCKNIKKLQLKCCESLRDYATFSGFIMRQKGLREVEYCELVGVLLMGF
ncbi:unnamed protein product [Fraxinus pennsylvanica]|uniref:Uncharacterized protein n=1 Tax=Fraxinus pennsylvanica TaxID=56036 RepID=A0AAD2AAD2_9LAMI|nr:unnamed protein product [Fraxinus pennsylvanica]